MDAFELSCNRDWAAPLVVRHGKDHVHILQGATSRLHNEEVRDWDEGQVNDRKDHIEPVVDVLETNGGDHEPDMR